MAPTPALEVERLLTESATLCDSHAANTRLAYERDWLDFCAWCESAERDALPASAETVVAYLVDLLHRSKISTAVRRAAGIKYFHDAAGLPPPASQPIRRLLKGAQRVRAERPNQKLALTVEQLALMCVKAGAATSDCQIRNRSLITLGFASALRRANLVQLDLADIEFTSEGFVIHVRREKQDQQRRGRKVGIEPGEHLETCPVLALRAWLAVRGSEPGPLYLPAPMYGGIGTRRLHPNVVAEVVKHAALAIGIEPRNVAANSLRSGMITAGLLHGIDSLILMRHTGHRSVSSFSRYFRDANPFRGNCSGKLGL